MSEKTAAERKAYNEKLRSIGVLRGGRTRSQTVREYRREDGIRVKETTDAAGNTVTEHNTPDDRVDVMVRPKMVDLKPRLMKG